MPKRLLVFCDGTGADANAIHIPTGVGFAIGQYATNVVRLSRAVKPASADGKWLQLVFYQSGVGSVTDFNASTVTGTTATQISGLAVATKIREAYVFIAQNFQAGDEICLFGFSRGAYTARKIAGLIDAIGLLKNEDLGEFYKYWAKLINGVTFTKPGRDTKIKCVGVWDTVGSVLGLTNALHISDKQIPKSVVTALHALSLQDNRRTGFLPTLWDPPASGFQPGQSITEVWFPGAHCDVGGGYENHELADLALFWMADKLTYPTIIVDLELSFVTRCRSAPPASDWGNAQPHNAWKSMIVGIPGSRLDLCDSKDKYHESILYAPTVLDSSLWMITLDDLKKKFSTSTTTWKPDCPTLGKYEKERKDHWKDTTNDNLITFEHEKDLFAPVIWVKTDLAVPIVEMIQVGNYENVARCVARVSVDQACYPGMAAPSVPMAWYGKADWSDREYTTTSNYEVLIGREEYIQWVPITADLQPKKIPYGLTLVEGGHDLVGTKFYIARYKGFGGKVRLWQTATYTDGDGKEYKTDSYEVLVYNDFNKRWIPSAGEYNTTNTSPVQINSTSVTIETMARPPVVAVGLNRLDIASGHRVRVIAFTDQISQTSFTAHINSWSDTVLNNGSLSWITLASNDPRYQCSTWDLQCDAATYSTDPTTTINRTISQRVNFPTCFNTQPKVFVGISGLNLDGEWYLSVTATDVDIYGFTMNVTTAANTKLYGIKVDWIAYLTSEANFWNGNITYNSDKATTVDFGIHFLNTPKVFTAITQFDIANTHNLRIQVDTSRITNSGMDIGISKWSDTVITSATAAYLAIDPVVGA